MTPAGKGGSVQSQRKTAHHQLLTVTLSDDLLFVCFLPEVYVLQARKVIDDVYVVAHFRLMGVSYCNNLLPIVLAR